ncbi:hypothetical protein VTO42DRAFT_1756 [Malbranchea cinnamomea]
MFLILYGTFKFKVIPFGLTNDPVSFQQFINYIFIDYLKDLMTMFVDDLLIYSKTPQERKNPGILHDNKGSKYQASQIGSFCERIDLFISSGYSKLSRAALTAFATLQPSPS